MKTRKQILEEAVTECYRELYRRVQPSANWDDLIKEYQNTKESFYDRYYLSSEECKYVIDSFIEAYGIEDNWNSHFELLEQYLINGGMKDKYIPERIDEDGFKHPGYRGYENVSSIKSQINTILNNTFLSNYSIIELTDKLTDSVLDTVKNCKEFYKHGKEKNDFSFTMYLGASPNSNKEVVIEYWKSKNVDLNIEWRNPLLFWERDYYGNEFEEVMVDEYGKDWEELWKQKWEIQEKEKQDKCNKILEQLKFENKNNIH